MRWGKIGARRMMWSDNDLLPPGARWVEYLESTGTQYIDTGIKPNENTVVSADVRFDISSPDLSTICAADDLGFVLRKISSTQISMSGGEWWDAVTTTPFNRHTYTMGWGYLNIDSSRVITHKFSITQYTTLLIGLRRAHPSQSGGLIVYSFDIDNIALRPIAIGTTGYMLDLVSGDYLQYGNAGTGDFVIGPDINAPAI